MKGDQMNQRILLCQKKNSFRGKKEKNKFPLLQKERLQGAQESQASTKTVP